MSLTTFVIHSFFFKVGNCYSALWGKLILGISWTLSLKLYEVVAKLT